MTPEREAELRAFAESLLEHGSTGLSELLAEIDRLKAGDFTSEEIQNFCHKISETEPVCKFADGCADYQKMLFGSAPDREDAERFRNAVQFFADMHSHYGWYKESYVHDFPYIAKKVLEGKTVEQAFLEDQNPSDE